MDGASNFPARRRAEMLDLLRHRGQATIKALASEFSVSQDTVRRDLQELAGQGSIRRTHGGALVVTDDRANNNLPFERRLDTHAEGKQRIGRAVADMVQEGQTIFINGGTTSLAVADHLAATRGITVVTNNLRLPEVLYSRGAREVYVLGGSFRLRSLVTIGPVALPDGLGSFQSVRADLAVIGVGGISDEGVISTTSLPEAGMMRAMIKAAHHSVILADSSKFGRTEFAEICGLSEHLTIVTDEPAPPQLRKLCEEAGVNLVVAVKGHGKVPVGGHGISL